jgi:hypothetical protein
VRIVVIAGERCLIREGSGAGHGIDVDLGLAHESALKEAEYSAPARASCCPLEVAVITGLQMRIKALPPARLEAFARGFRAAFQVPDAQPSLAGLITTSALLGDSALVRYQKRMSLDTR